jgi:hypothetical protein
MQGRGAEDADDDEIENEGDDSNDIILPDGRRLRLGEGWDAEMASSLIAAIRDGSHEEQRRVSVSTQPGSSNAFPSRGTVTMATLSLSDLENRARALKLPGHILTQFDQMISQRSRFEDVKIGPNVMEIMVERVSVWFCMLCRNVCVRMFLYACICVSIYLCINLIRWFCNGLCNGGGYKAMVGGFATGFVTVEVTKPWSVVLQRAL